MDLSTNSFFIHSIDELCTICHVILKDTDSIHSIFSTLEELEFPSPMNVLQVLQTFSNFNFYYGPQMVCTTCYDKTIEVYKFIQMCNKAHENMQHNLKNVGDETDVDVKIEEISIEPTRILFDGQEFIEEMENEKISKFEELGMAISGRKIKIEERILKDGMEKEEIKRIRDQTDVDVKVEEISIAPTRIIINGREFLEEMENEKISKFDELGMIVSGQEIATEKIIFQEEMGKKETSNNEEITISSTEIVTKGKTYGEFDNARVEKIDAHMHDEQMGCNLMFSDKKVLDDHCNVTKCTKEKPFLSELCNSMVGTKHNLKSHDQRHDSQRAKISKDFDVNQDRHQLLKAHETDVVCMDLEGQKVFNNDKQLKIHMRTSHKKKFLCNHCGEVFTTTNLLNEHMHVHITGEKPFTCLICKCNFADALSLRTHMEENRGKPYKCEQCDLRFTTPGNLRRHMHSYHRVKPYKCEHCDSTKHRFCARTWTMIME